MLTQHAELSQRAAVRLAEPLPADQMAFKQLVPRSGRHPSCVVVSLWVRLFEDMQMRGYIWDSRVRGGSWKVPDGGVIV